ARLAALKTTPTPDLKKQWRDLFDSEPPPFNRRYLESRLAYRIQELAYGGLKPETIRRLERLGEELEGGDRVKRSIRLDRDRPITGTRLLREWQGEQLSPGPVGPIDDDLVPSQGWDRNVGDFSIDKRQLAQALLVGAAPREAKPVTHCRLHDPVSGQRLLQGLDAEAGVHGIRQPPAQHLPAMPVHDGHQVKEPAAHGDIRNL